MDKVAFYFFLLDKTKNINQSKSITFGVIAQWQSRRFLIFWLGIRLPLAPPIQMQAFNLICLLNAAKTHMEMEYNFEKKWKYFEEFRYRLIAIHYPHKPFSVEESSFDFFAKTLDCLNGKIEIPEKEKGREFTNNYIDWLVYWKNKLN